MKKFFWLIFILGEGFGAYAQDLYFFPFGQFTIEQGTDITSMHASSDGELIVAGDSKGMLKIWNINTKKGPSKNLSKEIVYTRFVNNDEEILVVDKSSTVSWIDVANGEILNSFELKETPELVTVDPSNQYLTVISKDGQIQLYDLSSNLLFGRINTGRKSKEILFIGYDRFSQQLAIITSNGEVLNYNPLNQRIIRELRLTAGEYYNSRSIVESASANRASDLFVSGIQEAFIPKGGGNPQREYSIMAYNWETGAEYKRVKINWDPDYIALGPGSHHVAIMNKIRKTIQLINLEMGEVGSRLSIEDIPTAMIVSDDNNWLMTGSKNGKVYLYSIERNASPSIEITEPAMSRSYSPKEVKDATVSITGTAKDLPGLSEVIINDQKAVLNSGGTFEAIVPLNFGKNKLRVTAKGRDNNVAVRDIYVTRLLGDNAEVNEEPIHGSIKKRALVIGNSAYSHSAPLKNAGNDANLIAETLETLGFEVEKIIDGSYEDMRRGIISFGGKIRDVDISVFYYAGHGLEVDGSNYLVPVDAEINSALDIKQKCISTKIVLRTMEYANDEGLNMIILDACRNNPFPTGKRGGAGLNREVAPSGTLIAFATDPGSVASDGAGENGLYTGELVKQMLVRQRIEDVFMNTRNNVEKKSNNRQRPWEEARLKGIFYLRQD